VAAHLVFVESRNRGRGFGDPTFMLAGIFGRIGTLCVMALKLWGVDAIVTGTGVTGRGPDPDSAE